MSAESKYSHEPSSLTSWNEYVPFIGIMMPPIHLTLNSLPLPIGCQFQAVDRPKLTWGSVFVLAGGNEGVVGELYVVHPVSEEPKKVAFQYSPKSPPTKAAGPPMLTRLEFERDKPCPEQPLHSSVVVK